MLAFMPFSVNLNRYMVTLERNEAHAVAPVVAGAAAFIAECATACGLTTGEFIATIVGMSAVGTGMVIANDSGVSLGNTAADNLGNLVDAADYPDYDTLSSQDQQAWGSREAYESAKFNSLMSAYGLDDARDRFYSSSGNFEFDATESERLSQIGDIGSRWASGAANTFEDIQDALLNRNSVYSYMGETAAVSTVDTGLSLPTGLYASISGTTGNSSALRFSYDRWFGKSTTNVIWVYYSTSATSYSIRAFSSEPFGYGFNRGSYPNWDISNTLATQYTLNDRNIYAAGVNFSNPGTYQSADISKIGELNSNLNDLQEKNIGYLLLYGTYVVDTNLPNYPTTEISESTPVYYPEVITEETPWTDYVTPPENSGGNDNPGEDDEVDLTAIIALLTHIDNDIHNLNIPGEPNLQPLITVVQHIDSDMHKFTFSQTGELKVIDVPVWTTLDNIYTRLGQMLSVLNSRNDVADAPDLIGDFDFDELEEKVPDLLETISDLAPFGSILLLSEMYSILANYTQIEDPELIFPFDFGGFDEQNHELVIDLSWLDDIKPLINFFCIAMLIIAIANATIRIVEIEAAS